MEFTDIATAPVTGTEEQPQPASTDLKDAMLRLQQTQQALNLELEKIDYRKNLHDRMAVHLKNAQNARRRVTQTKRKTNIN